jgi:hypothetical protein
VLAVWLAALAESAVSLLERGLAGGATAARAVQAGLIAVALIFVASNWADHDQSRNRVGEAFTAEVFAALPQDAVLVSYWDTLTNLGYAHCIEGRRPDLALVTYDRTFSGTCDLLLEPYEQIALERPMYALFVHDFELDPLRESFDLVPVRTIKLPYGYRFPEHDRTLFRLELKAPPA